MRGFLASVPWFVPGVVVTVVIALAAAPRVTTRLRCPTAVAVLLVGSIGLVCAATLTPLVGAIEEGIWSSGTCSTRRTGFAAPSTYLRVSDAALNVVLFVPLGVAIGLLPWSRSTAVLLMAGVGLSIAVEGTQMLLPVLGRGCETADIVDNTAGLVLGLAVGSIVRSVLLRARGPDSG
jgi:glycopeptide antibiotics resistance protein